MSTSDDTSCFKKWSKYTKTSSPSSSPATRGAAVPSHGPALAKLILAEVEFFDPSCVPDRKLKIDVANIINEYIFNNILEKEEEEKGSNSNNNDNNTKVDKKRKINDYLSNVSNKQPSLLMVYENVCSHHEYFSDDEKGLVKAIACLKQRAQRVYNAGFKEDVESLVVERVMAGMNDSFIVIRRARLDGNGTIVIDDN